ncbi:MAG: entericidin A/B family lipoprotein [Sphingomonadaceae bacterium]|nr:entericidin A/B family lipoprotein [Sphingomonadaceae bacterium]
MSNKALSVAFVALALLATACNTVRGAGRDVQSVGSAVENTAK